MTFTYTPPDIIKQWEECKCAYDDANSMWEAQGKWRPDTVRPWFIRLGELATSFKSVHGIAFDPHNRPLQNAA